MTVKPNPTFEYCSLHYLNQWLTYDKKYCKALSESNDKDKRVALGEAAVFYAVARTLPTKFDTKRDPYLPRYQPILEILNGIENDRFQDNPVREIYEVEKEISGKYGGNSVLSATTKFLWLKVKHPIVIYDSRARIALGSENDYFDVFYEKWHEKFSLHQSQIENACARLSDVHLYAVDQNNILKEIEEVSSKLWFHERVFDSYLWHKGSGN